MTSFKLRDRDAVAFVAAGYIPDVKDVEDHMVWAGPMPGIVISMTEENISGV